jgi:biopolymer transport protein ExbD
MPQVNATSSADIAFILLLFFLLTGSLSPKTGIYRRLLPDTSQARLKQKTDIEKRNILTFTIDENNRILMENDTINRREIRDIAKEFIANPDNLPNLPRKEEKQVENIGAVEVAPDAVIVLRFSRKADYQTYIYVLGELSAAYDELRNELSFKHFEKPYSRLAETFQAAVREVYPLRISEQEIIEEKEAAQ